MIESIDTEYVNISIYSPLSASSYIKILVKLRNSVEGLINTKNNVNKCFLLCHIRHLTPSKTHPEKITKADKKIINDLDYEGIEFPVLKKDHCKIELKIIIFALIYFVVKIIWFILFIYQIKNLKTVSIY